MDVQRPIRVLIADDSAFMRHTLATKVLDHPDIEVVGTARDGVDTVEQVGKLRPDVLTLDVEMPRLNGLEALRQIMAEHPLPVVMLSSRTQAGAESTIRALELGAIDFVAKPSGPISLDIATVRTELIEKIRHAASYGARGLFRRHPLPARTNVDGRMAQPIRTRLESPIPEKGVPSGTQGSHFRNLVIVGASTGGPRALKEVFRRLEADASTAYLIVQHMPAGFTRPLADRLNECSPLRVREATSTDRLAADTALVAPGDYHLWLDRDGRIELGQGPRLHGVRPSVDVTLESAARNHPNRLLAIILTGMGSDGTFGAAAVRAVGGYVIAEHESTCVVYGMPRSVVEAGHASEVVPIERIAESVSRVLERWNSTRKTSIGSTFSGMRGHSPASI